MRHGTLSGTDVCETGKRNCSQRAWRITGGIEKGTKEYEVDENYEMELLPKQQIALVVEKSKVDEIVELIKQELYTGHIGDGKIFVSSLEQVIRIRTGETGDAAV